MRIHFINKPQTNINELYQTIDQFDLINYFSNDYEQLERINFNWLDSYTDNSRYELDVYNFDLYNNFKTKNITTIELRLNFNLDFDFKLFANNYVNYWKDDNIEIIKPMLFTYNSLNLGVISFNALTASFLKNIYFLLNQNKYFCKKIKNKIVLSFESSNVDNERLNLIVDNFINAIYEMVKITSAKFNYSIPDVMYQVPINMADWYSYHEQKNSKKKKKKKK